MITSNSIVCIAGKSGCGKTTLAEALEYRYDLKTIKSYTTRPRRHLAESGHIFINKREFSQLKDIVAETYYNNNYYCATSNQVDKCFTYVINPYGIEDLKHNYKGEKTIRVIYIDVPWYKRLYRMLQRGDDFLMAVKRLYNDSKEFKGAKEKADYIIKNRNLEDSISEAFEQICRWRNS